jgi:hypothetical protein
MGSSGTSERALSTKSERRPDRNRTGSGEIAPAKTSSAPKEKKMNSFLLEETSN